MSTKISKKKKVLLVIGAFLSILMVLAFLSNVIVSRIAESKIRELMAKRPATGYDVNFKRIKVNLLTMTVTIKDIAFAPDSLLMSKYLSRTATQKTLFKAEIPTLKLRHINVLSIMGSKVVNIREILYDNAKITLLTGGGLRAKHKLTKEEVERGINVDRIEIPGIGGVDIGLIRLNDLSVFLVNPISGDTILNNSDVDFTLDNLYLIKNPSDTNTFRLDMRDMRFEIKNEHFDMLSGDYDLSFGKLSFTAKSQIIRLEDVKVNPRKDIYAMAARAKYRSDIYRAEVDEIDVKLADVKRMLIEGNYYLPQIKINGLNLFVLRNRSLPFDETKHPLLPGQLLKEMKTDIDIDSLFITNGKLVYEESNNDKTPPLKVSLDNLNVRIFNITSIHDSMSNEHPMKIRLNAKLQDQIPIEVFFTFPLASVRDTFSYYGTLGGGDMSVFNPMLESAVGVKFSEGKLKGIEFNVEANDTYAMGTMTMLYNDLVGTVLKKDSQDGNKFLSWVANQVVKADNPYQGQKTRVVPIYFDRAMYKGFGNFAFKPLLSGILATTIPTFENSNQKSIDVVNQTTKRDLRKRRREERRDQK